jgi:hypothetical protein
MVLSMQTCQLNAILRNPIPWAKCTEHRKSIFLKIHEWSQSSDAIESLVELSKSKGLSNFLSKSRNLPKISPHLELDTKKVAGKVNAVLEAESITRAVFAKQVVKMDQRNMSRLLNHPTPWDKCSKYKHLSRNTWVVTIPGWDSVS